MATSLMPPARHRGWTNGGDTAAGCKLYTYEAGTSTPKATFQDPAGLVPHENPITLDAKGEALIYWDGNYRIDLRTSEGSQITGYPVDNFETPLMKTSLSTAVGGGLIGFNYANGYEEGSIGKWLQNLANSAGSALIGCVQAGVGAVTRSIQSKLRATVSADDFGAVPGGVVDCGPAIRRALDSLPACGGTVIFETSGPYLINEVVYIPTRTSIFGSGGVRLLGRNTTLKGSGTNNIFESGTGNFSTVALGGATNFTQPFESVASIHYNSSIEGFNFMNCGHAIKLCNWIQGCVLRDLYATNFTTMIETLRCFYLSIESVQGRPLQDARLPTTPIFRFVDSNNTMTFLNVHCSGITPTNVKKGVGFEFDGGVQGVTLPGGCSAEGCVDGLILKSIIYSMNINGFYFEANTTAIRSIGANLLNFVVDNCEFEDNGTDINVDNWVDGYFGSGNKTEGIVTFGNGCTHAVELPVQSLSDLTHTNWIPKPANWTVPGGCEVMRNDIIFNSGVGFSAPWFRNAPASSGGSGIVPAAYTGNCFVVGNIIPFCSVTGVGATVLTIDTKIAFNDNMAAIRFDLAVAHTANAVIAGVISCNNTVFRDDAQVMTVAVLNFNNFLRIQVSGFGLITSFSGKVRVI